MCARWQLWSQIALAQEPFDSRQFQQASPLPDMPGPSLKQICPVESAESSLGSRRLAQDNVSSFERNSMSSFSGIPS